MHILWIIIIGFVAGIIARMLAPGPNNPAGFILTTLLGIAGAQQHFSMDNAGKALRNARGPRQCQLDRLDGETARIGEVAVQAVGVGEIG